MAGVNVNEIAYGILDPGTSTELYFWDSSKNSYNNHKNKARFFSVTPDIAKVALANSPINFEITRVWNTLWLENDFSLVFQTNVAIENLAVSQTAAFHLIEAETDN